MIYRDDISRNTDAGSRAGGLADTAVAGPPTFAYSSVVATVGRTREDIAVDVRADVAIFTLAGDWDAASAAALEDRLADVIAQTPCVIDLTGATFIDSSIVGVLLASNRRSHLAGRPFALALHPDPASPVRRVLGILQMAVVMPCFDTLTGAVLAVRAGTPEAATLARIG
jgi:anti-anti-sigma factor